MNGKVQVQGREGRSMGRGSTEKVRSIITFYRARLLQRESAVLGNSSG